jgi:hypothetical protein
MDGAVMSVSLSAGSVARISPTLCSPWLTGALSLLLLATVIPSQTSLGQAESDSSLNGGQDQRLQSPSDSANPSRKTLFQWSYGTSFGGGAPLDEPLVSDRPNFTQSSTTVGRGVSQFEMGYTYIQDDKPGVDAEHESPVTSHRYPELLARLGLFADWFELELGCNYAHDLPAESVLPGLHGGQDIYVAAAIAITPQEGILPEMALIPQVFLPTGAKEYTADEFLPGLNWVYSWEITDRVSLGGSSQANRAVDSDTSEAYTLLAQSFCVQVELAEHLGSFYEWYVFVPDGADSEQTRHFLDAGFTIPVTLNLQFDVRAGFCLSDSGDDFYTGAGLSVRL